MRTLNKTLALVLALVMVLGMFGVATAADFTDDETIQYKEAVDVMTGIGAINGMDDGTFAPTGMVTRAQAAKMVAYAVLGENVAKTLPVSASSFTDVDANFAWAIPSIEYLVGEGVINGRGDGTFDPNGNVTAYEIAKMLLCAAGYGKNGEFVGSSWALNVAILAQSKGIFAGTKATNLDAGATREECALCCFNGITEVVQVNWDKDVDNYIPVATTNTIVEDTYGTALVYTADATDSFGNPAVKWTYKGVVIGTYAATADFTFTKDMDTVAGNKELAKTFKGYTWNVSSGLTSTSGLAAMTANGTIVNVFVDDMEVIAVTAVDTELAEITKVHAATKTVTIATVAGTTYTVNSDNPYYDALVAMGEEAYALVRIVGTDVAFVAKPTVVTGALTKLGFDNSDVVSLTVAGKTYPVSAMQKDIGTLTSASLSDDKDVTIYVDTNGYALYITEVSTATPYFCVAKNTSTIVDGVIVNMATGYAADGTVATLNVGTIPATKGALYSYAPATAAEAKATNAEYTLTEIVAGTTDGTYALNTAAIAVGQTMFDGIPYASDVKFIFMTDEGVTVKTGVQAVTTANTAKALVTKNANGTLLVSAVYVGVAPVDATGENILYLAKATGTSYVDGKAVFGYIAMIDGVPTPLNAKSAATAGTFYNYAKDDTSGVYTLGVYGTLGVENGVKNSTAVNEKFESLTAGYILETKGNVNLADINAKDATIVDLTQGGVDTLADIADAKAAGKTVVLSVIYDDVATSAKYNTVSYIYVVAVVELEAAATAPNTFVLGATGYTLNVTAAGTTGTLTVKGLPAGIVITAVTSSNVGTATVTFTGNVITVTSVANGSTAVTIETAAGDFTLPVHVAGIL